MATDDGKEEGNSGSGDATSTDGDADGGDPVEDRPRVVEFQGSQKEFLQSLRPGDKLTAKMPPRKRR